MVKVEKRILLVEDEAVLALRQQKMLSEHGYDIMVAASGEAAVEVSAAEAPDLVLMDIDLGSGLSGPDAAAEILRRHQVPIVFLTSHAEKEMVDRVRSITRYGYVLKNSGDFVLLSSIEMAFELFEAHRKLLEQDAELRRAQQLGRMGSWVFDLDQKNVLTSAEAQRIYGLPDREMTIPEVQSIPLPEYRSALDRALADLIHGRAPYDIEFRIRRVDDGAVRWIHSIAEYDSRRNRVVGTIQDITKIKAAEEAARQAAGRLEVTLDSIGDGVIAVDCQGRVERLNPVAERLTGWSMRDAAGRRLEDVFCIRSALTGLTVENPVAKVLSTGRIVGLANHTELVARNGTVRQIADSAAPIIEKDGIVRGVVLVFRDVTEEYATRNQLMDAGKRFSLALNAVPMPVIIQSESGEIEFLNQAWIDQAGYSRYELQTIRDWTDRAYGDHAEQVQAGIEELFALDRVLHEGVFSVRHADGSRMDWDFYTAPLGCNSAGERTIISIAHDVSGILLQQRENAFLARVLDQIQDLVTVTDLDGKITYVNEVQCRFYGLKKEDIVGKRVTMYGVAPGESVDQQFIIEQTKKNGQWRGEVVNLLPDGKRVVLSTRTSRVTAPDGHSEALCGISTDITGYKKHEEQLELLLEEKEILLREVHHRIKNDMAIIVELLAMQQLHLPDGGECRALDSAIGRVKTMMHLYESLYQRKVDTGKEPVRFLGLLIEQLQQLYRHRDNVQLTADFPGGGVLTSRQLFPLGIIVNELVTNSYKYAFTDNHPGTVSVFLEQVSSGELCLRVTDSGPGWDGFSNDRSRGRFGMQLIGAFSRQLHGRMEHTVADGYQVEVIFPVDL